MESSQLDKLEDHYGRATLVREICIFPCTQEGEPQPNQVLKAVILPNFDVFRKDGDSDIYGRVRWELDNLQIHLPAEQHLTALVLTSRPLKRNALQRIDRPDVMQRYQGVSSGAGLWIPDALSPQEKEIFDTAMAQKIRTCIAELTSCPIHGDSHWEIDLGMDSLKRVELASMLEAVFDIKIPDESYYRATTVKELIAVVTAVAPGRSTGEVPRVKGWGDLLREAPRGEIAQDVRLRVRKRSVVLNAIGGAFLGAVFKTAWSLKAEGVNLLPAKGPFIICPNHASFLDGMFIYNSLPFKHQLNAYFFGYYNIFYQPSIKWTVKGARLVAIDNNLHLKESLQIARLLLAHQKIACIFPEGMRAISDKVGPFYKGAAVLAKELDVPLVPAFIHGSHQSWPRGCDKPRLCPVKVIFGRPCDAATLAAKGTAQGRAPGDVYETVTRGLRAEIMALREAAEKGKSSA